ncbi:hypothetical protein IJJ97_00890, partial [bacterium]|nr:hypothetical protein [bacterium]
ICYQDGTIKYIDTEEVQSGTVTINVAGSEQNIFAKENASGEVENVVVPGFYNANNQLIASWELVTGDKIEGGALVFDSNGNKQTVTTSKNANGGTETVWGWDYSSDYNGFHIPSYSHHIYNIIPAHPTLRNATKLVMPEGVTKFGQISFSCWDGRTATSFVYSNRLNLETIVFPNTFTQSNLSGVLWNSEMKSITNLTIRSDNPFFDSIDGIIYTEADDNGNHESLVYPPTNKTKIRVLDGTKNINGCMYNQSRSAGPIGSGADIEMPNSIIYASFSWMDNLKWVEFTEGTQTLNIDDCSNCTSVFLPKTITTIPKSYNSESRQWSTPFWYSINIVFYVEPGVNTSGWADIWNSARENGTYMRPVNWNISREDYETNYRN